MAKVTFEIVHAIRACAQALGASEAYQWGHMGACNCGFLAQEITHLKKHEIHQRAMQRYGDWNEQLNDYCPTSGRPMDEMIRQMLDFGFDIDDLKHLERLSDPAILSALPSNSRNLERNKKSDVVLYLNTWADRIEDQLLESVRLPADLFRKESIL
jgi:hypothetical protein